MVRRSEKRSGPVSSSDSSHGRLERRRLGTIQDDVKAIAESPDRFGHVVRILRNETGSCRLSRNCGKNRIERQKWGVYVERAGATVDQVFGREYSAGDMVIAMACWANCAADGTIIGYVKEVKRAESFAVVREY